MASNELESLLVDYIDDMSDVSVVKPHLQNASADVRYDLLKRVRALKFSTRTVLRQGALKGDIEIIKYMLEGFAPNQIYNIVSEKSAVVPTPVHTSAYTGNTAVLRLLMMKLSQNNRFEILKIQDIKGRTALHIAAEKENSDVVSCILASLTIQQQRELLNIQNNEGKKAKASEVVCPTADWIIEAQDETNQKVTALEKEFIDQNKKLSDKCDQQTNELKDANQKIEALEEKLAEQKTELDEQKRKLSDQKSELLGLNIRLEECMEAMRIEQRKAYCTGWAEDQLNPETDEED